MKRPITAREGFAAAERGFAQAQDFRAEIQEWRETYGRKLRRPTLEDLQRLREMLRRRIGV